MKIRAMLAIVLLTASCKLVYSQACIPLYRNDYKGSGSDEALGVRYTADGGSIVSGRTTSSSMGDYDGFIMKLSPTGTIEWSRNFGGTGYDELSTIIPLSANEYLAGGLTRSFSNTNGEPFLVKINSSGGILWAKTLMADPSRKHRLADILQLADNSILALINANDSTVQGNAVALKLDGAGVPVWSREFNYGSYDAFCSASQKGDTLLIGGFATTAAGNLAGTIVKLGVNGQHYTTWSLQRKIDESNLPVSAYDNKVLMVAPCPEGIMFSQATRYVNPLNGDETGGWSVITAKHNAGGDLVWSQQCEAGTGYYDATKVYSRAGRDHSFMYLSGEGRPTGFTMPEFQNAGFTFNQTLSGRRLDKASQNRRSFYSGMDTTAGNGYLVAGYSNSEYDLTGPNQINVQKLDDRLRMGNCTGPVALDFIFTVEYTRGILAWTSVTNSDINATNQAVMTAVNDILAVETCSDTYCPATSSVPDQCLESFSVNLRGERLTETVDFSKATSGQYWAAGGYSEPGTRTALITSLNPDGSVNWAWQYSDNRFSSYVKKIVHNPDGTAIVAMNHEGVIDHGYIAYVVISKMDATGAVMWSRTFENNHDLNVCDIIATGTGDYLFIANEGFGSGDVSNHLVRINGNGDIVWKKQMHHPSYANVGKAMVLDGNDLYIAYDKYTPSQLVQIERWDAQAGTRAWSRSVDFTHVDAAFVHGIFQVGSTMWTAVQTHVGGTIKTTIFPIRTQGDLMTGITIEDPTMSVNINTGHSFYGEHRPRYVTQTSDNNFVIAQEVNIAGSPSIALIKINSSGNIQFAKHFPDYNNHGISSLTADGDRLLLSGLIGGLVADTDPRVDRSFLIAFNNQGEITDDVAGCQSAPLTVSLSNPPLVLNQWDGPSDIDGLQTSPLESQSINIERQPATVYANTNCRQPALCNSLDLQGSTQVCDTSLSHTFTADRNSGCTTPVSWQFDPLVAEMVSQTDNSITLHFINTSPAFVLRALLSSGCRSANDEMTIEVVKPASAASLGLDAVICPGNRLTLDPGAGFESYLWNDGSTDPELVVTGPGSYYVDVTDGCNHPSRASIVIGNAPPLALNLGADHLICLGDSVTLRAPAGFQTYNWSPSWNALQSDESTLTVYPTADTMYALEMFRADGCRGTDTVKFTVSVPPPINLGKDTSLCKGSRLQLDAGAGFASYHWNSQSGDRIIEVLDAGNYFIDAVTPDGCHSRDTLIVPTIYQLPEANLLATGVICRGTARELSTTAGLAGYSWNTGASTSSISVSQPGSYSVIVRNNWGCLGYDTTVINRVVEPPAKFLGADTSICSYGSIQLKPSVTLGNYQWSSGGSSQALEVNLPGLYWLSGTDANGCSGRDSITISLKDCMVGVYTPTAFTPNNDGKNDVFKPSVFGPVLHYSFKVFDRNGNLVFSTTDANSGWNGSVKGIPHGNEVFVWMCEYQLPGEAKKMEKGTVHLIR